MGFHAATVAATDPAVSVRVALVCVRVSVSPVSVPAETVADRAAVLKLLRFCTKTVIILS